MSKDKISDYSATANSNTDIGGINIDEGCAPSGINDAIRTLMKQLKDWQSGSQDVYIHPAGSASVPSITATGDTNTGLFFPAADTVGITTGGTERARVDSSGNMGLGVTPSTWTAYSGNLQTQGGSIFGTTGSETNYGLNAYYNAGYKYVANGYASVYQQYAGQHIWKTAASGTAGNAISFTQAMTLDASGNLGVGTTSMAPAGSRKGFVLRGNSNGTELIVQSTSATDGTSDGFALVAAGTDCSIINRLNGFMTFNTNNTERARITSGGDFLIGRTTSSGRFCVSADTGTATGNRVALFSSTYTGGDQDYEALGLVKYANVTTGNVFLRFFINNGSTGSGLIQSNGASTAAFATYSDARLKENIVNLPSQLDNIMALRPVEFDYIESQGGGHQIGFVAQEMQNVYADSVTEGNDGMLTIAGWDKTTARLVKAIQEQQAIITQLQADVAALKGQA